MSEPMSCMADQGTCPCSLVTATGGECGVFGPLPTFAEAFPYLAAALTDRPEEVRCGGEEEVS